MRKLILHSALSPGDIVMLTAAVRDLHAAYPGEYLTDVRTPCPALWEHNPHLAPIADGEGERLEMHYPLIQRSNDHPWHFIHGYRQHLETVLGRPIPAGPFRGDLHLSAEERGWLSQVEEIEGAGTRFWIIVAGGKHDFTAKWPDPGRLQAVVDHFAGRIRFVQVGEAGHHHPLLRGVLDLRGKTDLRQLVRLVHHADGVVCPVTSLMHLAAAVPTKTGALRPCVVIAGGREPSQWEAYPGHRYLDTIGALPCCATGGCWKSRVVPLGDGDGKDRSLCERPVEIRPGVHLPQCLHLISAEAIIRAVDSYLAAPIPSRKSNPGLVEPHPKPPGNEKSPCTKGCGHRGSTKPPRRANRKDPAVWGPKKWAELHARPDHCDLTREHAWLEQFTASLPCPECRTHFTKLLTETPPDLTTADTYFAWTVEVHNAVNRRVGRTQFSVEDADRIRVERTRIEARIPVCMGCDSLSRGNSFEGPKCGLIGPLKGFVKKRLSQCPIGRWRAAIFPAKCASSHGIGLVIGTYGAIPYIHLQLESLRRFNPGTPCLVVDDGSPQKQKLAELCGYYGAEFRCSGDRKGHVPGDMAAFLSGLSWAKDRSIRMLAKFSRRWVPIQPWTKTLLELADSTGATTLSNVCTTHGFGFRSECVVMDVDAWHQTDATKVIREHIYACKNHPPNLFCGAAGILVEHVIHVGASVAKRARQPTSQLTENFVAWPLMGTSRTKPIEGVLWHESCSARLYLAALEAFGVKNYTINDLLDPGGNIHR